MAMLMQKKLSKKVLPRFQHINLEFECITHFTKKWTPKLEYIYVYMY